MYARVRARTPRRVYMPRGTRSSGFETRARATSWPRAVHTDIGLINLRGSADDRAYKSSAIGLAVAGCWCTFKVREISAGEKYARLRERPGVVAR